MVNYVYRGGRSGRVGQITNVWDEEDSARNMSSCTKFPSLDSRPSAPCPQVVCSTGTQEIPPSSGNEAHTEPCKVFWLDTGSLRVLLVRMRSKAPVQLLEH